MNFLPENPNFADILDSDVICNSQPISLPSSQNSDLRNICNEIPFNNLGTARPPKYTGQQGDYRSIEEIDPKYRTIFTYSYFNLVQSRVIDDALYSDKSMVVCAPTGSGKTVIFEMAIAQLLMEMEDKNYKDDFKIIYMAPIKALCTERLTEWYPKLTNLGLLCIEVTGDTDVEFPQLKPYKVIITTPEKWDMLTRRWKDYRGLVEVVKLFLIDEVHILNDNVRGPVLEAVVSRMKTIESSVQSAHRIEQLQKQYSGNNSKEDVVTPSPRIRFVAISATVNNPEDVAAWLGAANKPAVYHKFGDECRPVKLLRVVEGYPCSPGTSIFKFDIILNYKLWPIIQKYHNGKPTLIFCNTRKSVALTAEALSREITINFNPEQKAKLTALASALKNKKLQALVLNGVGCHHAGLLFEERMNIEQAFRNRHLPILITTTTLAMGVNLPAHLVIIKNTQQYVNGAYQEYSISTILQMVGRAGRPQFDTEATAVIMTRMADKARYQALVDGTEPLQSFLHKRLAENLNSEAALGTVTDVAQCVQWVNSTFLCVRASKDPRRYLGLPQSAPTSEISKKIQELCVIAMNGLASAGLIVMDEASCIESTEAGKLMSVYYLDLETMKLIMKIEGSETLDGLLWLICESHELSDMHLRVDERRCLNALNRSNTAATIRFPMKGKISSRQMKLNCVIQAVLGCLPIPDPSLNQEAMKIMRIALRVSKCLVAYISRPSSISQQPKTFSAVLNSIILAKCLSANIWENSPYVSKQLRGIGPAFSMLLASAGKTNFLLLEESHPRDLERIMNKGPPAGNVIRKQISLLPKYQITITPIDKNRVQIQLMLLNQAYLSENFEQFTAGVNHKSYIIVGDSENNLLHLTSFKDTDLIKIYDGCITCEVTKKCNCEHKIIAHCVSSSFAGIDVATEYLFVEIDINYNSNNNSNAKVYKHDSTTINIEKQKTIHRKRKVNKNEEVVGLKCDSDLLKKIRHHNESVGKNNSLLLGNIHKNTKSYNEQFRNVSHLKYTSNNERSEPIVSNNINTTDNFDTITVEDFLDDDEMFEHMDDENQVDNILSEIENEMGKTIAKPLQVQGQPQLNNKKVFPEHINDISSFRKTNKRPFKRNFNMMNILEKHENTDDKNDMKFTNNNEGFTDAVKVKIDQYIHNTKCSENTYKNITNLLQIENNEVKKIEDRKSLTDMDVDKILVNCSQGQKDRILIPSVTAEKNPIPIQNSEKHKFLNVPTHSVFEKDVNENKTIEDNTTISLYCERDTHVPPRYDSGLATVLPLSPSELIYDINELNHSRSKDISYDSNVYNNGEIKTRAQSDDSQRSIFHYTIYKESASLDSNNGNKINKCYMTSPGSVTQRSVEKSSHNSCFEANSHLEINSMHKCAITESSSVVPYTNHNLNNDHENHNINKNDKNIAWIENYSFRSGTELNVTTENNNHTIKIISKIQIGLDIANIVSITKENTNIYKQEFNNIENTYPIDNKTIEPDLHVLDMEVQSAPVVEYKGTVETMSPQTMHDTIHEQVPDQFMTKRFDNIEDILNKYKELLGSRTPNIADLHIIKKNDNDNVNEPTVEKTKRLYKLSEIHNLQVPLPQKNKKDNCNLTNFYTKVIERGQTEINHNNDLIDISPSSDKFTNNNKSNTFESAPLRTELLSESNICSPELNSKMPSPSKNTSDQMNFNINKSLFNPRSFLQRYDTGNREEIIPPPEEFADNTNLCIDSHATNICVPCSPNHDSNIYHYNKSFDLETKVKRNIFNMLENIDGELKPAVYVTSESSLQAHSNLHLTQNNNCECPGSSAPNIRTLFFRNSKAKLGEFRYKSKNVMKFK